MEFLASYQNEQASDVNEKTVVAIVFTILGCFFSSISLVMMKFAHNRFESNVRKGIKKSPFCDWVWLLAFIIIILGNIFNVLAIDFGNPLLLATSCCISIVFTTCFCVVFLKEKLFCNRIIAIFVILLGSALFLSRAKNPDLQYTQIQIFALYERPISLAYIFAQVAMILGFMTIFFKINGNMHRFVYECQNRFKPNRNPEEDE